CVEHIRHEVIGSLGVVDVVPRTSDRFQTLDVASVGVIDRDEDSAVVLELLRRGENVDRVQLIERLADQENRATCVVTRVGRDECRRLFYRISHLGRVSSEIRDVEVEDVVEVANVPKVANDLDAVGISDGGYVRLEHLRAVRQTEEQRLNRRCRLGDDGGRHISRGVNDEGHVEI
ncbi:hypothetical protein PFISCL1PPCAC_13050, partial [Pristionchus fissidentatus]